MFPLLLEAVGWRTEHLCQSVPQGASILFGDSQPVGSLPMLLSFVNVWLRASSESRVVFVSFQSSLSTVSALYRKAFNLQLSFLSAQNRFHFIDALTEDTESPGFWERLRTVGTRPSTLLIVEGFASIFPVYGWSLGRMLKFWEGIAAVGASCVLWHWSRDFESDYPPNHSHLIAEDVSVGGQGWQFLLGEAHFCFCFRPLRTGLSRDVAGEVVACIGPRGLTLAEDRNGSRFCPLVSLYKFTGDLAMGLASAALLQ